MFDRVFKSFSFRFFFSFLFNKEIIRTMNCKNFKKLQRRRRMSMIKEALVSIKFELYYERSRGINKQDSFKLLFRHLRM